MEYLINCNTSSLAPHTTPLTQQQVAHIYRRLGFSASVQTINTHTGQTAGPLIDTLINEALNIAPLPAPVWANWNRSNYPANDDDARALSRTQRDELGNI